MKLFLNVCRDDIINTLIELTKSQSVWENHDLSRVYRLIPARLIRAKYKILGCCTEVKAETRRDWGDLNN